MIPAVTEMDQVAFRYESMIRLVEKLLGNFPHQISQFDSCYHFFGGKFRVSPELIVDQYEYWGLVPDDYFPYVEKHLKDVKPGWEIDLQMTFENGLRNEPLVTHTFNIVQRPLTGSRETIATYYVMAPLPNHAIKR
jgi:hypothetical protein